MTSDNFCYWLQGYLELTNSKTLSEGQVNMIKEHLSLVFNKVTSNTTDSGYEQFVDFRSVASC